MMKSSRIAFLAITLLALCAGAQAQTDGSEAAKKRPPRPDRVYLKDLEGVWMNQAYLSVLKSTRSPRAAALKTPPIVIQMKRDNNIYPILTTNFRSAVMQFVVDVEPDRKPKSWRLVTAKSEGVVNSADVIYTYFTGKRGAGGKFESLNIKEPHFAKRRATAMAPLNEPLESFVNKHTIAGKYKDEGGGSYEFSEAGDAQMPDRKFAYEVLLYVGGADCDLLASHHEKDPEGRELIGFVHKGDKVQLYKAAQISKGKWKCESQPFATLTRGDAT